MQIQQASKRSHPTRYSATDEWLCNTAFSQGISTDTGLDTFKGTLMQTGKPLCMFGSI